LFLKITNLVPGMKKVTITASQNGTTGLPSHPGWFMESVTRKGYTTCRVQTLIKVTRDGLQDYEEAEPPPAAMTSTKAETTLAQASKPKRKRAPRSMPITAGSKRVECAACLVTFSNRISYKLHTCPPEVADKVFFCKLCNIVFKDLVRKKHNDVPY